jgi:hypothetical protein
LAKYRQHFNSTSLVSIRKNSYLYEWKFFYEWLGDYLIEHKITDEAIWKALKQARNSNQLQCKFARVIQEYQRLLPLRIRYWIRDQLIKFSTDKNL